MNRTKLSTAVTAGMGVISGRLEPIVQVVEIGADGKGQVVQYPLYEGARNEWSLVKQFHRGMRGYSVLRDRARNWWMQKH